MRTNVLRFPMPGEIPKPPRPQAPLPAQGAFDAAQAKSTLAILDSAVAKAEILVGFVREDRSQASAAGIEGVGLEIMTILESERFVRLRDALEEAVRSGEGITLSHEGLGKLHRLEALVAEGEQQLARSGSGTRGIISLSGRSLSQASSSSSSKDFVVLGALVILGAVAVTLGILLAAKGRTEKANAMVDSLRPNHRLKSRTINERYS
jgi:hypothetical protein